MPNQLANHPVGAVSPPEVRRHSSYRHKGEANPPSGEELRSRLTRLGGRFRPRLREADLLPIGRMFPVQTLPPIPRNDVLTLHDQLRNAGISAVLHRRPRGGAARVSFLITARHDFEEIDRASSAVGEIVAGSQSKTGKKRDYVRYLHV